jgi:hypothetical protein
MKDWTAKLNANPEPVVRPMPKTRIGLATGDLCLLPLGAAGRRLHQRDPQGQVRESPGHAPLARRHKADGTCPVYLCYHLRTVAEAACEARDRGAPLRSITPVRRVIDAEAPTLQKLAPRNAAWISQRRAQEAVYGFSG